MRLVLSLLLCLAASLAAPPARAQFGEAAALGEWVDTEGARLRVVLGSAAPDGTIEGAVEIDLKPGWKTYWIAPGPFGIAPSFDAGRSRNLVLRSVEHPAPRAFEEFGELSVGYKDDVAFPLRFTVPDPAAPARLAMTGFLGVCESICVPVMLRVEGDVVTGQSTPFETGAAIRAARSALPEPGEGDGFEARVEDGAVVIAGDMLTDGTELFVAPPPGTALGVAVRDGAAFRAPILRGDASGTLDVVVRDGDRETRHAVPIVD